MLLSPSRGHEDSSAHGSLTAQRGKGDSCRQDGLERFPGCTPSAPRISADSLLPPAAAGPSHAADADDDTDFGRAPGGAYQCERRTFRSKMAAPRE